MLREPSHRKARLDEGVLGRFLKCDPTGVDIGGFCTASDYYAKFNGNARTCLRLARSLDLRHGSAPKTSAHLEEEQQVAPWANNGSENGSQVLMCTAPSA